MQPNSQGSVGQDWASFLGAEVMDIYKNAGFLREPPFGTRPALLLIDAQYNFTGDRPEPVSSSSQRYRLSCGEYAWQALPHLVELLDLARSSDMPVIYTRDVEPYPELSRDEAARGWDIVEELAPRHDEMVVEKVAYSGFFLTRLLPHLIGLGVDTLIVGGGTTSGCVRATVTDAFDYRFNTFVVEDCVFDRHPLVQRSNLFDIAAKYAKVLPLKEVAGHIEGSNFGSNYSGTGNIETWRHDSPAMNPSAALTERPTS